MGFKLLNFQLFNSSMASSSKTMLSTTVLTLANFFLHCSPGLLQLQLHLFVPLLLLNFLGTAVACEEDNFCRTLYLGLNATCQMGVCMCPRGYQATSYFACDTAKDPVDSAEVPWYKRTETWVIFGVVVLVLVIASLIGMAIYSEWNWQKFKLNVLKWCCCSGDTLAQEENAEGGQEMGGNGKR